MDDSNVHVRFPDGIQNDDDSNNLRKIPSPPPFDTLRLSPVIHHHTDGSHGEIDDDDQLIRDSHDSKEHVRFIFKPIVNEIESSTEIVESPNGTRARSPSIMLTHNHVHDPNTHVRFSDGKKPVDDVDTCSSHSSHKRIPSPPPPDSGRLSPVIYHHEHINDEETKNTENVDDDDEKSVKFVEDPQFCE